MSVSDRLRLMATLYEEKNKVYGDQYKRFGDIMMAILGPIHIRTASDYNRAMTLFNMITKIGRYSRNFSGEGHPDSLDDLSVYSQMLSELDDERNLDNWGENEDE